MSITRLAILPVAESAAPLRASAGLQALARQMRHAALRRLGQERFIPVKARAYNTEVYNFSDFPYLLGKENVLYHTPYRDQHRRTSAPPQDTPYPSLYNMPESRFATTEAIAAAIRAGEVDAVIASCRVDERGRGLIALARKHGLVVALLDNYDHEELYAAEDPTPLLTRGFRHGEDFDLYFKSDLPLGCATESIRPLAPFPVRPEMCVFPRRREKDISVFSANRLRRKCMPERGETMRLLCDELPDAHILIFKGQKEFPPRQEYNALFARAKLRHSPAGRSCPSFIMTETGLCDGVALLAPRPWIEMTPPGLVHGENAVLYEMTRREGRFHLQDPSAFLETVRAYTTDDAARERIARRWQRDVLEHYTTLARAKHLLAALEAVAADVTALEKATVAPHG